MTRALIFTHHFPSKEAPSRAPYSYHTYRALRRHCDLRVVAPIPWWWRTKTPKLIVSPLREDTSGIEAVFPSYYSIPAFWPAHALAVAASTAPLVAWMRRDFPFDVILAAWAYPDSVGAAHLAKLFRVPLLVTVLGSDVNESGKHFALKPQIASALKSASRVIAVSAALGDRVEDLGVSRSRIEVVRNGVDGELFSIRDRDETRRRLGLPVDRKLAIFVGNLLAVKGVDVLVEAAALLQKKSNLPISVVMVGGGPLADQLKARAQALGISEKVHFTGRVLPTEVPAYMNAADVFCLPSREEGCPNVVLEALASGKPVVASRVGGIPELVDERNGILAPPEDPNALADALISACSRSWDENALRHSVPSLSWNTVGDTYARLINEALIERRND
ncbi:MAG: glycosyltransferase family 4 protein [Polyangiaceae bacterium]|nr:glycosyltransferase family 4 protein [Polyangiaceae bacterium]